MSSPKTSYRVHERFVTFQGEGVHMGRKAFFVRLFGCPVHCPWCDSAGTWHPKWVPKDVEIMPVQKIVQEAVEADVPFVVVTGGEPAIFDLEPLVEGLHTAGQRVHLETSGAFKFGDSFDWVTVSPKKWKPPLVASIWLADEFKIIVEEPSDIDLYCGMLTRLGLPIPFCIPVWLHPEWGHREDPMVLKAVINQVRRNEGDFRAGYQIHKLFKVDTVDPRSRSPVPLGGDPVRGL